MSRRSLALVLLLVASPICLAFATGDGIKSESFDHDPGWEGLNNRATPTKPRVVTQDFGYSPASHFAGKSKGEVGGQISRAAKPAYYAETLKAAKTLNDKLSASGSFAITKTDGGGGFFFGYFNSDQPGGSGRAVASIGLDFDCERTGARLAVRMITSANKTCGKFVTPFVPGKFRPTPIKNDGTRYDWSLDYDPEGANGNGQFKFTIKSDSPKPEEFEGKPFTVDVPAGLKAEGATFDRFGMLNMMKAGATTTVYFDDVAHDGEDFDFSTDPAWTGSGNRERYEERRQVGAHNFGYSPDTNYAGGAAKGEVGGDMWRSGAYAYYADRVGPLSLNDKLEASGKVMLRVGAPDSDVLLGFFAGGKRDKEPSESGDFIGVHIGGPTRIGHYFAPFATTSKGTIAKLEKAPVLVPGKALDWTFRYDPAANDGNGAIHVTLGTETATLKFKPGVKPQGGRFDRFGLFNSTAGGQLVEIYLDDLKYTTAATSPQK